MTPFELPDWAKQEEACQAEADRDVFISRSFLRVLGVVGRLREMGARQEPVLPSAAAMLFLFFWLIMTALARTGTFLLLQAALVLALLALRDGRQLRRILAAALAAAALSALLVLPAVWLWGSWRSLLLPAKAFLSFSSLGWLLAVYPASVLSRTLSFLRVPRLVIFLFDTTLRHLVILGGAAGELLSALELRSVGKNHAKERSLTQTAGWLFLRSRFLGSALYEAMICRGFDGTYPAPPRERGTAARRLAAAAAVLVFLLYGFFFLEIEGGIGR